MLMMQNIYLTSFNASAGDLSGNGLTSYINCSSDIIISSFRVFFLAGDDIRSEKVNGDKLISATIGKSTNEAFIKQS